MSKTAPIGTIRLQGVGRKPAVEAQFLSVGDTLMWNAGETTEVLTIVEASPKFVRITEKSTRTGAVHDRRLMKTRLVARVASSPQQPQPAAAEEPAAPCASPSGAPTSTKSEALQSPQAYTADPAGLAAARRDLDATGARLQAQPSLVEHTALTHRCAQLRYRITEILAVLAERFPVDSTAVYVPEEGEAHRDVVVVKSGPDADGMVEAVSARHGLATIRVALDKLQPMPELSPAPEGPISDDWWNILDREGNQITQVQATGYEHARREAEKDPKARAASRTAGGLVYRRAYVAEVTAMQSAPAAAPVAVRTEFVGRSIPTRLRVAGAPGDSAMSSTGLLVWRLPDGEELTPGEAAKRFLNA
ncbi:hypothetical protein ACFQ6U_14145 [Streptomyces sp. NPDC056465]|uniref:hypothetical protein n=1 Tax=unclassified Streptomyces TaxID=2593676 RepID=UPI0035E39A33